MIEPMENRNRLYYRLKEHRKEPRCRDLCIQLDYITKTDGFTCHHCGEPIYSDEEASMLFSEIEKGMLYAMHHRCAEEICDPAEKPPIQVFPLPGSDFQSMSERLCGTPTRNVVYTGTVPWSMYGEEAVEYRFAFWQPGFLCNICHKEIPLGEDGAIIASGEEPGAYYTLCRCRLGSCKPMNPEDCTYPGEWDDAWEICL